MTRMLDRPDSIQVASFFDEIDRLQPGTSGRIRGALERGAKINATKIVRDVTGCDLRTAKDAVDQLDAQLMGRRRSGCSSTLLILVLGLVVAVWTACRFSELEIRDSSEAHRPALFDSRRISSVTLLSPDPDPYVSYATPSLHFSITPSLHHSTTPFLHHSISPSLHHSAISSSQPLNAAWAASNFRARLRPLSRVASSGSGNNPQLMFIGANSRGVSSCKCATRDP